jgi:hypothetical protein
MKRFACLSVLFLLLILFADAQTATVRKNVNLRSDPSTQNNPITTLKPTAQLNLVEPDATNGYFHVTTTGGKEGWVWGRNIKLNPASVSGTAAAGHVGPPQLYPDPAKTPGLADTLKTSDLTKRYTEGCPNGKSSCTYSQAHRDVPAAVHTHVYDEYNVAAADRNIKFGEVDHFFPLCAGGSNDIKNLWDQPADNQWNGENFGCHEKDKLETYVCDQIKAGKLDPKDAYSRITTDWVKFYLDVGLDSVN